MLRRRPVGHILIILTVFLASLWFLNDGIAGNEALYLKTDKGLFYLKQVYETLSRNYVDELDPEELSKSAIKGIVGELDPYTVFIERNASDNLKIITKGKYGGLGMEISKRDGVITVVAPMANTPAQKAGILAGDQIIEIDGESTKEMSLEDASSKMRGKIGTKVTLKIKRPGLEEPFSLTLTRAEIILKDVPYADFIEPGTAYFTLAGFSDKAADELKAAIRRLQKEGPIERVILDLRGNPGGLLSSAVEVANIFLPKGELVVSTIGANERESKFKTTDEPLLPDQPLVVLINHGSASASEIVAGAIQDLDRGVVVGKPSFGKGLVQQVFPIDKINDAFLKVTTAKYYIPSGRCIQKQDYKKNKALFNIPEDTTRDETSHLFKTRNGREVRDEGGIRPDVEVERKEFSRYLLTLWAKGYLFKFTVNYIAEHPEVKEQKTLTVDENILGEFKQFLAGQDVDVDLPGEKELDEFLKIAAEEKYSDEVVDLIKVARQKLNAEMANAFEQNKADIVELLEVEFAEKLQGDEGRIAAQLRHDEVVTRALEVLKSPNEYRQILAIKN